MTPQPTMKNYLFRKVLVIEIEMPATDEGHADGIGQCFVNDMLKRGQVSAEMRNTDVRTYRIYNNNGIESDVMINN